MPQGEALRSPGRLFIQAHGQEHMGGTRNTCSAGRTCGGFHTRQIQEEQQGIPFTSGESEVCVTR
jgi:hypothetical protein